MDTLNSAEVNGAEDNAQKEAKKRISYVSRDHKSMVDFVGMVYKNLGFTDYHSNKAIATIHGLSPDSIKQHLTSAQQYKLLEIKFGTGYKVTDLFKRIFLPVNDMEKRSAVIESLKSPETYQQLFKEYEFHILPPLSGIKNHFVRNVHLREDIAEKAAQIFIDNLHDYDLLDARGVLISGMNVLGTVTSIESPTKQVEEKESKAESVLKEAVNNSDVNMVDIVIPLKSTKSKAVLSIPEDYKEEDLDRIMKFVDALK